MELSPCEQLVLPTLEHANRRLQVNTPQVARDQLDALDRPPNSHPFANSSRTAVRAMSESLLRNSAVTSTGANWIVTGDTSRKKIYVF